MRNKSVHRVGKKEDKVEKKKVGGDWDQPKTTE